MSNARWMSKIQHDPRLVDMVLPASHDAGVYGDSLSTVASPKAFARTQGSSIFGQAEAGSRVFDVRVFLKRVKSAEGKKKVVPTMGHFAGFAEKAKWPIFGKSTGALGAYGGSFITAVSDAVAFVKTYDTEVVILRISHTYCPEQVADALDAFIAQDGNARYIYRKDRNIARCRINELRGKVVLVFDNQFHKLFDLSKGYLPLYKYGAGYQGTGGLCFCGTYKGVSDMKKLTATAAGAADEHRGHARDHLHWVYWQQTVGLANIHKATTGSKGAHAKLSDFLGTVQQKIDDNQWKLPNVIGHDFVNEASCRQIIELNPYYGD